MDRGLNVVELQEKSDCLGHFQEPDDKKHGTRDG